MYPVHYVFDVKPAHTEHIISVVKHGGGRIMAIIISR